MVRISTRATRPRVRGEHIAGRMRVREDEQASMTEVKTVVERIPGAEAPRRSRLAPQ